MYDLFSLPCEGSHGQTSLVFWRKDLQPAGTGLMHPRLLKRMMYVLECANAANVWVHHNFMWKSRLYRYYLEVVSKWGQVIFEGHTQTQAIDIDLHECYYLGSWGSWWNFDNQARVGAWDLKTENTFPMGDVPAIPGVWTWEIEKNEPYDWEKQYGPVYGKALKMQKILLQQTDERYKGCLKKYYPYKETVKGYTWSKPSYNDKLHDVLNKMRDGQDRGDMVQTQRYEQKEFDQLKKEWVDEYGYKIRIPSLEDVIHVTPNFAKTPAQIHAEKKANLQRVLDSPAPAWGMKYATVMTWIDNIQDAGSIVFPAIKLLAKAAPKLFGKLIPIAGWLMFGNDILQFLNYVGRAPLTPMKSKRGICDFLKHNPFTKKSIRDRANKVKNYNPNFGDILQALQTTDSLIGVGLSLGPIMGVITDSAYGAYRYLSGDPVSYTFEPPNPRDFEKYAAKAARAAAYMSTTGQMFDDTTHFWSYIFGTVGTMLITPLIMHGSLVDMIENPHLIAMDADRPTDPITLQVIKEAGLDVDAGVGWPYDGSQTMSLEKLSEVVRQGSVDVFRDYSLRHSRDQYGYGAAMAMDINYSNAIEAMEPDSESQYEDPAIIKVLFRMIKTPIIPQMPIGGDAGQDFYEWVNRHYDITGHTPGVIAIEAKLTQLGIKYTNNYPPAPTLETNQTFGSDFPWGSFD